jgi:hypothetical protein
VVATSSSPESPRSCGVGAAREVVLSSLGTFNPGSMALRVADVFLGAEPEPEAPAPEPIAVAIDPLHLVYNRV